MSSQQATGRCLAIPVSYIAQWYLQLQVLPIALFRAPSDDAASHGHVVTNPWTSLIVNKADTLMVLATRENQSSLQQHAGAEAHSLLGGLPTAKADQEPKRSVHMSTFELQRMAKTMFDRCDMFNTGSIDSKHDMERVALNLIFKLKITPPGYRKQPRLGVQQALQEFYSKRGAEPSPESPITRDHFLQWFSNEFGAVDDWS